MLVSLLLIMGMLLLVNTVVLGVGCHSLKLINMLSVLTQQQQMLVIYQYQGGHLQVVLHLHTDLLQAVTLVAQ